MFWVTGLMLDSAHAAHSTIYIMPHLKSNLFGLALGFGLARRTL